MSQTRRVSVRANSKDRMRVNIEVLITVHPGVLIRSEVDEMRKIVADKLMNFLADDVPFLRAHLSDIKVSR